MKERFSVKKLAKISIVAAVYFVLTIAISPLSFGNIQFRFSEVLVLLCFFNKDYIFSLTLGCFLANLFSPMAALDVPFGTIATLIAVILVYKSNNLWIASVFPTIINAVIVGIELSIAFGTPFLLNLATVALGEFVVVTVIGVPVMNIMKKNKKIMELIEVSDKKSFILNKLN